MENYIEALRIIMNEKEYDYETHEWKPFPRDERQRAFTALASFVASTARGDRRRRILQATPYGVPDWGILRRLWYYPETGKVRYVCGQDWNTEMAILRDAFDWQRR